MIKKLLSVVVLLLTPVSQAVTCPKVVATVNKTVITSRDVDNRLRLFFMLSRIEETPENVNKLRNEIFNIVVSEEAMNQEFKRLGARYPEQTVEQAYAAFAGQYQMSAQQLDDYFKSQRLNPKVHRKNIRTQLMWQQYLQQFFASRVSVSPAEVDAYLKRRQDLKNVEKLHLHEIVLPFTDGVNEPYVRNKATMLLGLLRAGAKFEALAQQFSMGHTAKVGGDLGWLSSSSLTNAEAAQVRGMDVQKDFVLVKSDSSYKIYYLEGRLSKGRVLPESSAFEFVQMLIPYSIINDKSFNDELEAAKTTAQVERVLRNYPEVQFTTQTNIAYMQMPPALQQVLVGAKQRELTKPLAVPEGGMRLFVSKIKEAPRPVLENIAEQVLLNEKLIAVAEKRKRELRQSALINIKDARFKLID